VPKKRGYFRIELPERGYQQFAQPGYPYAFEYPVYGKLGKDSSVLRDQPGNPYWLNIDVTDLGARIYISYTPIRGGQSLAQLLEDSHFMTYYHTKRADYMDDRLFRNAHGVSGAVYEWGGDAASAYQFVATDSVRHFVRGALYFNATPNADSIRPAAQFLKADLEHLLKTFRWQ
jgi:gliding motility-associated lipoprotein GldD